MAAFLLQIIGNEEEVFYYMISILSNTEYSTIFEDNLYRIKQFFYVLERLIVIYMPELHNHLKNNGVFVSYYSSPWLITLFSSCYQFISESVNPKILLRIWDDFIIVI